jgi:hypothetical protein
MAQISLSSNTVITPWRVRSGSPRIATFQGASTAATTATIKVGNVVCFADATATSAHRLMRCSTGVTAIVSTSIAGIAAADFSPDGASASTGSIPIWAADNVTEFKFPTKIAGTTPELLGTVMSLEFDSSLSIHYLRANSTAAEQRVRITQVIDAGDTNGYVAGVFISSACSPAVCAR